MEQFVQNLQREAKKMFESDEYAHQRQEMVEQMQKKQQEMMEGLMARQARSWIYFAHDAIGHRAAADEGRQADAGGGLSRVAARRKRNGWRKRRGEIEKKVEDTLREGKKLEREIAEKLEDAGNPRRRIISCAFRLPSSKKNIANIPKSSPISTACAIIF